MSLVYRREGLLAVRAPVVLQEFVNHGGVLFKVYVIGDHATCVMRRSLPDVPEGRLADLEQAACVPFANVSSLPVDPAASDDKEEAEMPLPAGFVDGVSRGLRRALGLLLFNYDLIRARCLDGGRRRYFLIDINYFPGYAKMPGYETALTDFFAEMLHVHQPGPVGQEDVKNNEPAAT
jgi:inositol-1,3,4-trisphosphate 5/6-kinase/inositol-tetrakisphosphate 1-kinase